MNRTAMTSALALALASGPALAEGQLNIYNWGDYTSPELIEKFEQEHDVEVTVTDYDSNDTALTTIKTGGHNYDIVVPSATYVPIFIEEGLLMETRPDQMENFENVEERFVDVYFDPGRRYTVPWLWGSTGIVVDSSVYDGDIDTHAIVFDPPEELVGKVNVPPEMLDVIWAAIFYNGGKDVCTDDRELLRKVRDTLVSAKEKWLSMDYGLVEKMAGRDLAASLYWNGAAYRARQQNEDVRYGYPKEGYILWTDSVGVLADAQNVENAKLFQNFIMDPENAAMISNFARYANAIEGSEQYMSEEMVGAPEVDIPEEHLDDGVFGEPCPPEVQELYTAIWTELQK